MGKYYMDNAATSYPKAPTVSTAICEYIEGVGTSVNRGAYGAAYEAENIVYETRELICDMFGTDKPENVIFTKNITESINILIKCILKNGDHVVVSSMEHNAVMRPLNWMTSHFDISYDITQCDENGFLDIPDFESKLKTNTKLVIMTHASNVFGSILDLESVGKICNERNIFFVMDTAQTAGILDIDFNTYHASAIAFTGHKGLLGPQGMGGFVISDTMLEEMDSFIQGGTGSLSEMETQPEYMPDKFESGTMNMPGIYGLNASLKYIQSITQKSIHTKEKALTKYFMELLENVPNIKILGTKDIDKKMAVCSIVFEGLDQGQVAYSLDKEFGIMTRCGLHCAPSAHKTVGTFPEGTVRFSFGHTQTNEDIEYAVESIKKIFEIYK